MPAENGDRDSMNLLIQHSEQMVYTNCLRLLKNPEEAEDMAQEVYLTAFLKLDTLKKPEAFFGWLKAIKINKCLNELKQHNPYFLLEGIGDDFEEPKTKKQGDLYARFEDKRDQISPEKNLDNKETQKLLLARASAKFRRRFRTMEKQLAAEGRKLQDCSPEEMDRLWNAAKAEEKR